MTTITLDYALINEMIAVGHFKSAEEAVVMILTEYLQEHKKQPAFFEQLRLADDCADDELGLLFERNKNN